jgi:hypothetical protein
VFRVGDLEFSNGSADGLLLIGRFDEADQGGGTGLEAGDAPAEEGFGEREERFNMAKECAAIRLVSLPRYLVQTNSNRL